MDEPSSLPLDPRSRVVLPRLLIGLIVLICAEVFSGASVQVGLWHPWTWIVTYWLYFAHFFLFTTLAVRTGRTSISSLYLWGVIFGMYEAWITKVIWNGYTHDGTFVMGRLGPFGASEISMVFLFHPVMSFILPLAVACVLCPSLRRWFPDLAWITGRGRLARLIQGYIVIAFGCIMAMNSGGLANYAANIAFILGLLALLLWWTGPTLAHADGATIVAFGLRGFVGLCIYLALLYGVTYPFMLPHGRPSAGVQLFTLSLYAFPVIGLSIHNRRQPLSAITVPVASRERWLAAGVLGLACGLALLLIALNATRVLMPVIIASFVLWTPLGFVLTVSAGWSGRERGPEIQVPGDVPLASAHIR